VRGGKASTSGPHCLNNKKQSNVRRWWATYLFLFIVSKLKTIKCEEVVAKKLPGSGTTSFSLFQK